MRMVELSDGGRAVIDALIAGPAAGLAPEEVASRIASDVEETTDLLCDLDVAGWVEVRETPGGFRVALSPLAAERLGLRLIEVGPAETPRWGRAADPDPPPPRPRNVCFSDRGANLEFVPDPNPTPDLAAERGERIERAAGPKPDAPSSGAPPPSARSEELPAPSVLLGIGLTPWPGPGIPPDPASDCRACGSRRLRPHVYCLCCDRWGLDRLLAPHSADAPLRPARPKRPRPAPDPLVERLQLERLRARRKAKRLERQQSQNANGRKRSRKSKG